MIYYLPSGRASIETDLNYPLSETEFFYAHENIKEQFEESMFENLKMQQKIEELENLLLEIGELE